MDPMSAITAAYQGLNVALNVIERLAAYRARRKLQRQQEIQAHQQFLHDFTYAAMPVDEESQEVETIRSYCKKLQNVMKTHWGFIVGRRGGRRSAQAAHAMMAGVLFQVGAMPGLPTSPPQTQDLVADAMTTTYETATRRLYSDVVRLLETANDLNPRQLSFTMQKVDEDIQIGFAMSANLQAKSDAAQVVMSSAGPMASLPYVDEETSQANLADLMASQSSPEDLEAAYARVESRSVQAASRSASPCSSQNNSVYPSAYPSPVSATFDNQQLSQLESFNISSPQFPSPCSSTRSSIYSSECPTPTYQAYDAQNSFGIASITPLPEISPGYENKYDLPFYRAPSYNGSFGSSKRGDGLRIDTSGWAWGDTVESPVVDGYPRKFGRSWSC